MKNNEELEETTKDLEQMQNILNKSDKLETNDNIRML